MKINVEVDCTPEEARRFLGLPDLTALHERYVARMGELMEMCIGRGCRHLHILPSMVTCLCSLTDLASIVLVAYDAHGGSRT